MRLGQDVGHKVGARRSRHNDHLENRKSLKTGATQRNCDGSMRSGDAHLLCGGASGLDGGLGERDLNRGQVWRQRVGNALHDVAHLWVAAHWNRDVLGHLWRQFGHLLQHYRR